LFRLSSRSFDKSPQQKKIVGFYVYKAFTDDMKAIIQLQSLYCDEIEGDYATPLRHCNTSTTTEQQQQIL
jgi:hypothetical protein